MLTSLRQVPANYVGDLTLYHSTRQDNIQRITVVGLIPDSIGGGRNSMSSYFTWQGPCMSKNRFAGFREHLLDDPFG